MTTDTTPRPPRGFWPQTVPGRWAIRFAAAAVAVVAIAQFLYIGQLLPGGEEALGDIGRATGPAIGIAFGLTGLGAFITALVAVIRHHERAYAIWLAIAWGGLMTFMLLGELLLPH